MKVIKARKKPVEITAVQWDGTYLGLNDIEVAFPELRTVARSFHEESNVVDFWEIATLEGKHKVSPKDWIIKGVKGEFYPCKSDIFDLTYDIVDVLKDPKQLEFDFNA